MRLVDLFLFITCVHISYYYKTLTAGLQALSSPVGVTLGGEQWNSIAHAPISERNSSHLRLVRTQFVDVKQIDCKWFNQGNTACVDVGPSFRENIEGGESEL